MQYWSSWVGLIVIQQGYGLNMHIKIIQFVCRWWLNVLNMQSNKYCYFFYRMGHTNFPSGEKVAIFIWFELTTCSTPSIGLYPSTLALCYWHSFFIVKYYWIAILTKHYSFPYLVYSYIVLIWSPIWLNVYCEKRNMQRLK